MCLTASSRRLRREPTEHRCSWSSITGRVGGGQRRGGGSTPTALLPSHRSTRESSSFTVVLNNLRVFLIFDWLQLVQEFLQGPTEKAQGEAERRQRRHSSGGCDSLQPAAVMPKTVKSGVVTKRSTVPVTQDRCLEVKINVTGWWEKLQSWKGVQTSF